MINSYEKFSDDSMKIHTIKFTCHRNILLAVLHIEVSQRKHFALGPTTETFLRSLHGSKLSALTAHPFVISSLGFRRSMSGIALK